MPKLIMRFNKEIDVAAKQADIHAKIKDGDKLYIFPHITSGTPPTRISIRKKDTSTDQPAEIVITKDAITQTFKSANIGEEAAMLFHYKPVDDLSPVVVFDKEDRLLLGKLQARNIQEQAIDATKNETKKILIKNKGDNKNLLLVTTYTDGHTEIVPAGALNAKILAAMMEVSNDIYDPPKKAPAPVSSLPGAVKTPNLSIVPSNRDFNPLDAIKDLNIADTTQVKNASGSVEIKNNAAQTLVTIDKKGIHASIDGDVAAKDAKVSAFVSAAKYYVDNNEIVAYEIDCPDEAMLLKATQQMIAKGIPVKITNPDREQRIIAGLGANQKTAYSTNLDAAEAKLMAPTATM